MLTIQQIALILQLLGFIMITVLASFLLAREVIGSLPEHIERKLTLIGEKWREPLHLLRKVHLTPKALAIMIIPFIISAGVLSCFILSSIYNEPILDWLAKGLLIVSVLALLILWIVGLKSGSIVITHSDETNPVDAEDETNPVDAEDEAVGTLILLSSLVLFFWAFWLFLLLATVIRKLRMIASNILVRPKAPRIILLVAGCTMYVTGIILELITTF